MAYHKYHDISNYSEYRISGCKKKNESNDIVFIYLDPIL